MVRYVLGIPVTLSLTSTGQREIVDMMIILQFALIENKKKQFFSRTKKLSFLRVSVKHEKRRKKRRDEHFSTYKVAGSDLLLWKQKRRRWKNGITYKSIKSKMYLDHLLSHLVNWIRWLLFFLLSTHTLLRCLLYKPIHCWWLLHFTSCKMWSLSESERENRDTL